MKLILTADIHLRSDHPERLDALKQVINRCQDEGAEYLLIAGDMFDANVEVDDIKTDIRKLFTDTGFQTFVIPGNHDRTAFREEEHFGEDIEILNQQPFTKRILDGVNLVAVPYIEGDFEDLLDDLADAHEDAMTNILLMHCTLAGAHGTAFGTESRYLPVKPEHLLQTEFDYVFAGHIHSSSSKQTVGDTIEFLYPGSPISITKSETGQRGIWILDNSEGELKNPTLNTFHYRSITLDISPGQADEELETLRSRLRDEDLATSHLIITATGYIEQDTQPFIEELERTVEDAEPAEYDIDHTQVNNVQTIVQTDLYQTFTNKLEDKDDIDRIAVERIALEAYSRHVRS